jgi:hypothetical protein
LPDGLVTAADRIVSLVTGGVYATGSLPELSGILVSLGGEPATIYLGIDVTTVFTHTDSEDKYHFRVFERIQSVVRDQNAFAILVLVPPSAAPEAEKE